MFSVFSHGWVERVFSWSYLMFVCNEQQFAIIWLWPCCPFWRYNAVSVFQQFAPKTWVFISIWNQSVSAGGCTSLLMEKHLKFWQSSFIYTPCRSVSLLTSAQLSCKFSNSCCTFTAYGNYAILLSLLQCVTGCLLTLHKKVKTSLTQY